ncbi:MAG: hypothetical protein RIS92_866 [Verrucomicrobiota bacterium]
MGKSEDAAKERGVVAFACEGALMGAAAAGEDEAGRKGFEFEVLQIVIVGGEVEVNSVLSQEWSECCDEVGMVSVHSVGENGVVSNDAGEFSAS